MSIVAVNDQTLQHAAALLKQGELVAFPTETVYGLGADASNPAAVAKIFAAKNRPSDHPLIVHLASVAQLDDWAVQIPEAARSLAHAFWPGPLAIILHKKPSVSSVVTGGQDTVALRIPNHPLALALLQTFGGGIAAPSANRFGRVSPTRASHVAEEFGDEVACILDGGACQVGVESTIVDLSGEQPVVLRPGRITPSQLEAVLQTPVLLQAQTKIRAPGMLAAHYAPATAAYLCPLAQLAARFMALRAEGKRVGLIMLTDMPEVVAIPLAICVPNRVEVYEAALYQSLRELDKQALDLILIEQPPQTADWYAVNDRLSKATV